MSSLKLISPVDGSVYAERPVMGLDDAAAAVARSRKAQKDWARRPLEERIALVKAGVARLNEMSDEVVPELAWMMGRPVRYGGEFGGVNERATTWPRSPRGRWRRSRSRTRHSSSAASCARRMAWSSSSRPGTTPT
jgi:acyl-CoA reductase-like NAD-dependent aldehyde dehydrogenase